MLFGHIISSPRGHLSLRQTLRLINVYLENASKEQDPDVAMVLCHDTEVSLSQAKKLAKRSKNQAVHKDIGAAYKELGKVLESKGYGIEARASYQKAEKWEYVPIRYCLMVWCYVEIYIGILTSTLHHHCSRPGQDQGHSLQPSESKSIESPTNNTPATVDTAGAPSPVESKEIQGLNPIGTISQHIFTDKVPPPNVVSKLPQPDERLISTPQLACCLSLLRASYSLNEVLEPVARDWLQSIANDEDEDERLKMLSMDVIRAYKRDEIKDSKIVSEVVCLAPVLDKQIFRDLLDDFYTGIDQAGMLKFQLLDGLAQMVQGADPGYLDADDLVKILQLLSSRLRDTHGQSRNHIYQLTMAASRVLDAMADTKVTGLDREALHLPLTNYLNTLKKDHDPCMVFQAAYAYQALLCVPDDESLWKATIRRTGKVIKGVSGLVSAVKGLDLNGFIEGLGSIQQGFEGVADMIDIVKTTVEGVSSLVEGGKTFIESLKEGLSFQRKCAWYSALRGADELIRQGEFASFKKLVCEAPCRLSLPFQWGVCQRLGEVAANPSWDVYTRRNAVSFLGEIYAKDEDWGHQESVKQWIIDILLIVSSSSENSLSCKSDGVIIGSHIYSNRVD
ncbi:hypothetical protein B0O80DRAFT_425789 [Mortierella sp. GBAus27b]|nr:hypothetical protein B0O80DRAFT_425789 [Mortierella sp. GBAus27b]